MSSENSRVLVVKSKLSLCSGSVTLTQLNPINEKEPLSVFIINKFNF